MVHDNGYVEIKDRSKDIIISGGENVSSVEVEDVLYKHPAVLFAAVVAKPDRERGALVKAFVVLSPEFAVARSRSAPGAAEFDLQLIAQLQAHVKGKLAPYEYPKEIEFIDALPMTTTGKVQRRVLRLREAERKRALVK